MAQASPGQGWSNLGVGLLLLVVVVATFWHGRLFFHDDDWIALEQMASTNLGHYLLMPDSEHWYPFFKLVFYSLLSVFGARYDLLMLVNSLLTAVNAFLLYLFYRRLFSRSLALVLALVYAISAAHTANIWTVHNITLILSFGFFLASLLLMESYVRRPRGAKLGALGLTMALALMSNNFVLLGLLGLPLYALLQPEPADRRRWVPLAATVGLVYVLFFSGYFAFAGLAATASHNTGVLAGLPGPGYLAHLFFGAYLSPFLYLFWGHYHFPVAVYFPGVMLLIACVGVIWRWGEPAERRLGLWALALSALPFLLASLVRYQRSLNQAFVPRYAVFTLIFALILVGLAWRILSRRLPRGWAYGALPAAFLALVVLGQLWVLPRWYQEHLKMSQPALAYYQTFPRTPGPAARDVPDKPHPDFMPARHPGLTLEQKGWIRLFLGGPGAAAADSH